MKKLHLILLFIYIAAAPSCKKVAPNTSQAKIAVTDLVLNQIKQMGYSTQLVVPFQDGYLVENDILINVKDLGIKHTGMSLNIAKTEQYRTTAVVQFWPRTITIRLENLSSFYSQALDEAIARYNRLSLGLTFLRTTSIASDIRVIGFSGESYDPLAFVGASVNGNTGGFPGGGNPGSLINVNTNKVTPIESVFWAASILQHEIGHTIGMRHTDYMNRSYSCGIGGGKILVH